MKFDELGNIRDAAASAWMKSQDPEAVRRALRTTTRTTDLKKLEPGDVVYVWRNVPDYHGWTGPGVVVAASENGRSLWVSMRGYLIKASREQTRAATSEESLGAELVQELSKAMLQDLESGNVSHFRDIEGEGGPDDGTAAQPLEGEPPPPLPEVPAEDEDVEMQQPSQEPETPAQVPVPFEADDLAMDVDIPMPQPPDAQHAQSEASTQAPSVAQEPETPVPATTPTMTPRTTATPATSRRPSGIRVDEGPGGRLTSTFGPMREQRGQPTMPYPFSGPAPPAWPSPSTSSNFYNILPDDDTKKVFWKYIKSRKDSMPILYLLTRPPMSSRMHVA